MIQKPGWTYSYIHSLQMHIAINDSTGVLYTEDKTMYTQEEALRLSQVNYMIPAEVHIIKKLFGGIITNISPLPSSKKESREDENDF